MRFTDQNMSGKSVRRSSAQPLRQGLFSPGTSRPGQTGQLSRKKADEYSFEETGTRDRSLASCIPILEYQSCNLSNLSSRSATNSSRMSSAESLQQRLKFLGPRTKVKNKSPAFLSNLLTTPVTYLVL